MPVAVSTWAYTMNHFPPPHTHTHARIAGFSSSGCHLPTNIKGGHYFTPPPPQRHRRLSERLTVELRRKLTSAASKNKKKGKICECDAAPASSVHDSMISRSAPSFLLFSPAQAERDRPPRPSARPPPAARQRQHGRQSTARRWCPPVGPVRGAGARRHPRGQRLLLLRLQDLSARRRPRDRCLLLCQGERLQRGARRRSRCDGR